MITYEEFKKVEIRAGKILSAEKIPDTDKLLKLVVDFAETKEVINAASISADVAARSSTVLLPAAATAPSGSSVAVPTVDPAVPVATKMVVPAPRQIVSGISAYFPDPAVLVGKTCMFVTNLEPRMIRGFESNGMLFAVSDAAGNFSLLEPNASIPPGTPAK